MGDFGMRPICPRDFRSVGFFGFSLIRFMATINFLSYLQGERIMAHNQTIDVHNLVVCDRLMKIRIVVIVSQL
ncbi:hypothetical protein BT69DRAFT_967303 [Atractiella rhizophila]|nr:hypothetical protein BT69DRAFT_967303 [Atractiella rhizophila]